MLGLLGLRNFKATGAYSPAAVGAAWGESLAHAGLGSGRPPDSGSGPVAVLARSDWQAQASAAVALAYHRSAVRWNSQARSSSEKAEKIAS